MFLSTKLGTLKSDGTPKFINYLDKTPQSQYLHRRFRPLFHLLSLVPIKSVQEVIRAGGGIFDVSIPLLLSPLAKRSFPNVTHCDSILYVPTPALQSAHD